MWKALLGSLLGVSKRLALIIAPILAGALADLLVKSSEKASAYIKNAAADPSLLSGEARHTWVTSQITPLLNETAKDTIPAVRDAVIALAVKSEYDRLKENGAV